MMNLRDRIWFWIAVSRNLHPFWYEDETGHHLALDSYNIFTDRVGYREGSFGTSGFGPYPFMSRTAFLALGAEGWRNLKDARS